MNADDSTLLMELFEAGKHSLFDLPQLPRNVAIAGSLFLVLDTFPFVSYSKD